MYHTTDEYNYCDSTPIGEKWPICNLQKGHPNNHESFDYWWETGGPPHAKEIPMPKIPFEKFARESPREWPGE